MVDSVPNSVCLLRRAENSYQGRNYWTWISSSTVAVTNITKATSSTVTATNVINVQLIRLGKFPLIRLLIPHVSLAICRNKYGFSITSSDIIFRLNGIYIPAKEYIEEKSFWAFFSFCTQWWYKSYGKLVIRYFAARELKQWYAFTKSAMCPIYLARWLWRFRSTNMQTMFHLAQTYTDFNFAFFGRSWRSNISLLYRHWFVNVNDIIIDGGARSHSHF